MRRPEVHEVFWCEEHQSAGYEKHCEDARSIGFVQFSSDKEKE